MTVNIDKIVAVSGFSNLFTMVGNRNDGLVLEDLDTKKRNFYSSRSNQFTPLTGISMYVEDNDTVALADVFAGMLTNIETTPPVDPKSSDEVLRGYLEVALPNFDRDMVKVSDIRKLIKWFNYLNDRGLLKLIEKEVPSEEGEIEEVKSTEGHEVL